MAKLEYDRPYTLKIAGRAYTVRSADAQEHVFRVAVYTDRKISETLRSGFVNREDAAIISALSIADELFRAQDDNTRLRRELWQLKNACKDIEAK